MFGDDTNFSKDRRSSQLDRFEAWLIKLESRPDYEASVLHAWSLAVDSLFQKSQGSHGREPNEPTVVTASEVWVEGP